MDFVKDGVPVRPPSPNNSRSGPFPGVHLGTVL